MKTRLLIPALVLLLACATAARATESLVQNGSGIRTKPILGAMYALTLQVPEALKGADGKAIIEADRPMEFVLAIRSRLITRARFVEATTEGFAKAAEAGYASDKTQAFFDQFAAAEFRKGDVILMRYADGALTTLYRKPATEDAGATETKLGSIPGLDFKKALFAIWLGDNPVQEPLKKALLGAP
jgi:hypothetical protein